MTLLERVLHTKDFVKSVQMSLRFIIKGLTHPFKFKATAQNGVLVDLIVRLLSTFTCLGVVSSILALFTVSSNMCANMLVSNQKLIRVSKILNVVLSVPAVYLNIND